MIDFKIHIQLHRQHFLITKIDLEIITENKTLIAYLNQSLQFAPQNWLDTSLHEIPHSLLALLSAIRQLDKNILERTPPHRLTMTTPIPANLISLLLHVSSSWEIQDIGTFTLKTSKKTIYPKIAVDFFEKKLLLKNSDNAFLLPTFTGAFLIKQHEIMELAPIFDSTSMIELFKTGIMDAPPEWVENLCKLPPKHPAHKWLDIPQTRIIEKGFKLTLKITKTTDGFLIESGLSSLRQTRKNFAPLPLSKIRQAALVHESFVITDSHGKILLISPDTDLYKQINRFTTEVYRHFFEFLGEIDENRILTKDKETLFHKFLPIFDSDIIIISENQIIEFKQMNEGEIQFDIHNAEDLENKKIDWLQVDFKYKIDDIELNLKQIREILKQGYTISNQKWITRSRESLEKLSTLFSGLHIETRKEGDFIHRYRIGNLPSVFKNSDSALSRLHSALSEKKLFETPKLPKFTNHHLREYQKFGVSWLQFLDQFGFGGILADEMGLGKTLQVLSFLASMESGSALIICPSSLIYNWAEEIERFFGDSLPYLIIDGIKTNRIKKIKTMKDYRILITSYNMAHLDKEEYQAQSIDYCIIDEAQHIKNKAAKRTRSIKDIPARSRIAITGTPIENNLSELWSVFDFLMPGFLGTHKEFKDQFETPINGFNRKTAKQALQKLKSRVAPFILRRTKAKVIKELPPKTEQIIRLELTEKQKSLYLETLENVKSGTLEAVKTKGIQKSYMDFLAALTRLRQVCLHTGLVLPEEEISEADSIKLKALIELIEEAMDSHHRVLVFSQFVQMLKLIRQEFHRQEIEYLYLDGKTKNRVALVNQFNNSDIPVFLISLRAGGVGLNLTGADAVILFDPWWNPAVENQAIDRAHRIGQHNPVHVYRLITRGTIEDKIHLLQKQKQGVSDSILSTEDHFIRNLTIHDIQKLFEEDAEQIKSDIG